MANNYHQGTYEIQNWDKYTGTKNPRYLSSYELHFFKWADRSPAVVCWSAEQVVVPYFNPVKKRNARYLVDIYFKYYDRNGVLHECLAEIKPLEQCKPPVKTKGKSEKTYTHQVLTWMVNDAKWEAAKAYANARGWEFRIITQNSLFKG